MTLSHAVLALAALGVCALIFAGQRTKGHPFDWKDLLLDGSTNRASLNAFVIIFMLAVSIYIVVDRENGGGRADDGVVAALTTILGVFVGGRVLAQGINAYKDGQPGPTTVTETTQREVTIPPPADPPAPTKGRAK